MSLPTNISSGTMGKTKSLYSCDVVVAPGLKRGDESEGLRTQNEMDQSSSPALALIKLDHLRTFSRFPSLNFSPAEWW